MKTNSILVSKSIPVENVLDEICDCVSGDVTTEAMQKIKQAIIHKFVGQWVYFPHRLMHAERNMEMLERFFGGEARVSLCREYKISRAQFYKIVKEFHQSRT